MRENHALARLRCGETVFGSSQQYYRIAEIPRVMAAAGFDFFFVDAEHGGFGLETVQDSVAAAVASGITPLVRVCELLYSQVARVLDAGAQGVIFPRVEDPGLLAEAIGWTRYPPAGKRGFGVFPPLLDYEQHSVGAIMEHLNRNVMVVVQFETAKALEKAEELLSVPGIDATMIGPADLSISLGVPGEYEHPSLVDAISRFAGQCEAHGIAPGIHCRDAASARFWAGRGMRFVCCASEHSLLAEKLREVSSVLRGQGY